MLKIKKVISSVLAVGILSTTVFGTTAFASETVPVSEYMENHYQVNFDDLDVYITDGNTIAITQNETVSSVKREAIQNDINMLNEALGDHPDMRNELIATLESGEQLAAVSVTEAPLLYVEDHYERVPIAMERSYESSDSNKKGNFSLYTSISRDYSANSNGTYNYKSTTNGSWSKNNILGGSDYPDAGEDYVLQSTPNTWNRKSHTINVRYDDGVNGVDGKEYWSSEGGSNYIRYQILDDPLGYRQNTSLSLSCTSSGKATTKDRMINSYYVHTWKSMSLDVSVGVSSSKEVSLSLSPSVTEKSWQLYNYISFNF